MTPVLWVRWVDELAFLHTQTNGNMGWETPLKVEAKPGTEVFVSVFDAPGLAATLLFRGTRTVGPAQLIYWWNGMVHAL